MTTRRCIVTLSLLLLAWTAPACARDAAIASPQSQRLWRLAAQEQATLEQRGVILRDASVSIYLETVAKHLWEQIDTDLGPPTLKIIMDTRMQAYAFPNGFIFLTTGMLDQIENEDQLAMIIAHEMVHYIRQHTAELYDHYRKPAPETGLQYADRPRSAGGEDIEQKIDAAEYQADKEGLSILKSAGYCSPEVLALLSNLMKNMHDQGRSGTQERLKNRMAYMKTMLDQTRERSTCVSATDGGHERYLNRIAPALLANAQSALQRGDWDQADKSISAFQALRQDYARAHFLKGEILRRRSHGVGKNQSIGYYEKALSIDPKFPPAQRALGELHFKAGRYRVAKQYFEAFLSLAPQDDDAREYIKGYLRQCDQ
jgi:predicted Zn-dependent protease